MTDKTEYKQELSKLDRSTRLCLLYLEKTMDERFKLALQVKKPKIPKVDFSKIESKLDSLQKQIEGLRVKVNYNHAFTQEYDNAEIFLKSFVKEANEVLDEVTKIYQALYKSKYFKKEGIRRQIREMGLIKNEPSGGLSN